MKDRRKAFPAMFYKPVAYFVDDKNAFAESFIVKCEPDMLWIPQDLTIVAPGAAGSWEEDFSMDRELPLSTHKRRSGAKRERKTTLATLL